jgi:predicted nucleic acid-binding protein
MNNSSEICIDANLVVRLTVDPDDRFIRPQWDEWLVQGRLFVAPTLFYYEVANALYQYERVGVFDTETVRAGLAAALALPIRLVGDVALHRRSLELSTEYRLRAAYDAHHLALAESRQLQFYTVDERLWRAVHAKLTWVHFVGEEPRA